MKRKTKEDYLEIFKKTHKNLYDYSLVEYVNNVTKVKIICSKHGIFEQTPITHAAGSGCYKCFKIQLEDFINESNDRHNNYYDYSLIDNIKNNKQKVQIICPEHGIFEQRIDGHLNGRGCKKCSIDKLNIGIEKFIKNSNIKHNYFYNYDKSKIDYINQKSKIIIICPKHGDFEQTASNHTSGYGCPKCGKNDSIGQKTIRKILSEKNIIFKEQKSFKDCLYKKYLFFDFYKNCQKKTTTSLVSLMNFDEHS